VRYHHHSKNQVKMSQSQFWRPSFADRQTDTGCSVVFNQHRNLSIKNQKQLLPIYSFKNHILHALEEHSTLILVSETGTGKSTQILQYLYESGWTSQDRRVVCTQPRRIAAITIAARVSEEMGCVLGNEVGYTIRFDKKISQSTKILFCTDGVLLRETMTDPLLSQYSVIMVDEVISF
jgi:ATP-dependent RNA helicase DDX35